MKNIQKFDNFLNESIEDILGISYDKVWVVMRYGDTDLYKIYLDIEEAKKVCEFKQTEHDKHFSKSKNKYTVLNLYDAIDWIKEALDNQKNMEKYYNE